MPPTEKYCNSLLGIAVDGVETVFTPGDVIAGQIVRRQPMVSAEASISLTLHGHAKTRLDFQLENQKVRRSLFELIDESKSRQLLHDGPIHIPPGGVQPLILPFAVAIPTHVTASLSTCGLTSYLPLDPASVAQQELPSTLMASSRHGGKVEVFIEYFLKADICIKGGETISATLPIVVHNHNNDMSPPMTDYRIQCSQQLCSVSSQRLLPGTKQSTELSIKEKVKMVFASDPVPRFGFSLEVGLATVIQLDDPEPIPVTLRACPDKRFTSASIQGIPQKVALRNMRMSLGSRTWARADGTSGSYELSSESKTDIPIDRVFSSFILQGKKVFVPCADDSQAFDIGSMVNLQIRHDGPTGIWKKLPDPPSRIHPDIVSYNFKVDHILYWEATLVVAGEECKVKGQQEIRLLRPAKTQDSYMEPPPLEEDTSSDSWIQPPAEDDAPPSFAEVQREDLGGERVHA